MGEFKAHVGISSPPFATGKKGLLTTIPYSLYNPYAIHQTKG